MLSFQTKSLNISQNIHNFHEIHELIKKILHKFHLDDLAKSMDECRNDSRGGFLMPTSAKLVDSEYARYRHLPINWSIVPITKRICLMNFHFVRLKPLTCSEGKC